MILQMGNKNICRPGIWAKKPGAARVAKPLAFTVYADGLKATHSQKVRCFVRVFDVRLQNAAGHIRHRGAKSSPILIL
jgi:hypothetical protein